MNIHDLLPAIIVVIVTILAASFSATILSSIQAGQTANTIPSNITSYGLNTLVNITNQMPNVGLIIVVAVIIGILIGSFIVYQKRK